MIRKAFPKISDRLLKALVKEFIEQGHNVTGKGLASINIKLTPNSIIGEMDDYMLIQSKGVRRSRIPYSGGRRRGGKSQFIQALKGWVKKKGIASNDKKALGIAFAIAKTMKKEGMPTRGAFKHSKNGRRLDWIDVALLNAEEIIAEELEKQVEQDINAIIDKFI